MKSQEKRIFVVESAVRGFRLKMSNKRNKEIVNQMSESEEEPDIVSGNDSDLDSEGNYVGDEELQVDFEGRNPEDFDFQGIKQLLRQLFLKSNVDVGALAQIIISQNYVGCVVKQCLDDDVDDDEEVGSNVVFAVNTVINITTRKDEPCIKQIRTLLTTLAEKNANDKTRGIIDKILSDDSNHVGLVINERIVNIPAAIGVPQFSSLKTELDNAVKKNMPYRFKYLIWICKTYNIDEGSELMFANQEEEAIVSEALASFDVDVSDQVNYANDDDEEDEAMSPGRKILIFEASKFGRLVQLMKDQVESA